jgi:hypothetical protein
MVTLESLRVQLCPLPGGHGDLGELFAGGSVLVHVPGGGQSVHADRIARPIGSLVGVGRIAHTTKTTAGALGGSVDHQSDLAEPGLKGRSRV